MYPDEKVPEKVNQPTVVQNRSTKRTLIFIGLFFGFLFFLGLFIFVPVLRGIFTSRADVPVPNISSSNTSGSKVSTAQSYETDFAEPQACVPVILKDAEAVSISPSQPGVKKSEDIIYYPIYGYTYNQLLNQISTCGTKDEQGTFAGRTNWRINWQFDYYDTPSGCQVNNVAVGVKVDIYYPEWQQPKDFALGTDVLWQQYMTSLQSHENQHKKIVEDGAQKIYEAISGHSTYSSCDIARTELNNTANQIIEQIRKDNNDFDIRTNHGANP